MDGMMDGGSGMWAMGLVWILVLALLVLGVAALIKYLFFSGRRQAPPSGTAHPRAGSADVRPDDDRTDR